MTHSFTVIRTLLSCFTLGFSLQMTSAFAAQTDLGPLNLPATSTPLPFTDNFDANGGTIPPYMALTNLSTSNLLPDSNAWCNVGQLSSCISPFSGGFNLEMGFDPGSSSSYYDVRNAMVLKLDGSAYTNFVSLSFAVIDFGEEADAVDGVWISSDGTNWYSVIQNWSTVTTTNNWVSTDIFALASTPVNVQAEFYIAFVQDDNFPYGDVDGIGIDDIKVPGVPKPPILSTTGLVGGQYTTMEIESSFINRNCKFLISLVGPGPTNYAGIDLALTPPIRALADITIDLSGHAYFPIIVPPYLIGSNIWMQAVVIGSGEVWASNALRETVQ